MFKKARCSETRSANCTDVVEASHERLEEIHVLHSLQVAVGVKEEDHSVNVLQSEGHASGSESSLDLLVGDEVLVSHLLELFEKLVQDIMPLIHHVPELAHRLADRLRLLAVVGLGNYSIGVVAIQALLQIRLRLEHLRRVILI